MGLAYAGLLVKRRHEDKKGLSMKLLVDSGAVYSLIPGPDLAVLRIKPHREMTFVLADGTEIRRRVGDAYFEYKGGGGAAPVIFGEKGDEPLLGATTLESLGLALNPFSRELYPMRMMLAGAARR